MTDWIVRRWKRFGHDRLYASTPGGTDLGYLDMASGRFHSDDLSNLPLLRKAIEEHLGTNEAPSSRSSPVARQSASAHESSPPSPPPPSSPTSSAVPECEVSDRESNPRPVSRSTLTAPPPVTPPALPSAEPAVPAGWHDLADVRAGAAARERALAEREAQGLMRHLFARMLDAKTDERAWRIGADGEQAVAEQLGRLGAEWRVLHAVRVGERGADIDHVVVGPTGVFTVNSKNHPKASVWVGGDTVMVNGRRVPYVRNSRFEAKRASRMLAEHVGFPVPVIGLVAVVGARRGFTVRAQPADGAVAVVPRRGIGRFLKAQPPRLGLREIDAIHEVARRSSTWQR